MKEAPRSKLSADFPKRIVDQSAETFQELLLEWPQAPGSLNEFIKAKCDAREWEKVWKKKGSRLLPAYRRKTSKA